MALRKFIIERDIPKVGTFEREQLRGAAAKSNGVLRQLGPDIQWLESYVADDKTFCVYLAKDEDIIRKHAEISGFPATKITEVRKMIDYRYALGKVDNARRYAAELIELAPDVVLAEGNPRPLLEATRTVPIVFVLTTDPVGAGLVESLARPGGNATGFTQGEYALSGKWLELVKEVAPRVTRVAVLRDLAGASGTGQFGVIQSVASSLGVEVSPINMRDAGEIERGISAFALQSSGGLIVTSSPVGPIHRDLIVALAARHQLPAVYHERLFVADGGLISYAPDFTDQYRQAAGYVDRILKGEKPADLPVQAPTKFELVINLKTAKALGLTVPPTLLARADEVIE